jgi:hypothetical protein
MRVRFLKKRKINRAATLGFGNQEQVPHRDLAKQKHIRRAIIQIILPVSFPPASKQRAMTQLKGSGRVSD